MERTHTPLSVWFWAAYLVASHTAGMSAVQFQRQVGLSRYETAFQILHKLRAGMVRPDADRIGRPQTNDHVEVDETYIGGATRGEGRGVHNQVLVACAVEVRQSQPQEGKKAKRGGPYAGRLHLQVMPGRTAKSLVSFVENVVEPGSMIITDAWGSYNSLGSRL